MRLLLYIAKRLVYLLPVTFGVLAVTFVVGRILPGDPIHLLVRVEDMDAASIAAARRQLGLDRPIIEQFVLYCTNLLRGDFGVSYVTGNQVLADLKQRLPATLELTSISLLVTALLALPLGVFAAVYRDKPIDHLARILSLVGVAIPAFWLGLLLIQFLYFNLNWLPAPLGRLPIGTNLVPVTGFYTIDSLLAGDLAAFGAVLLHLAMPVMALSVRSLAAVTRMTRSSMIEVLSADFILSARAQGLSNRSVYFRLALRNALLSPVTVLGQQFGQLLGGAVVVEFVFAWPGLGFWAVTSATSSDYAPVQAFAVLAAALNVLVFLIVDIVYFWLDPRIRY